MIANYTTFNDEFENKNKQYGPINKVRLDGGDGGNTGGDVGSTGGDVGSTGGNIDLTNTDTSNIISDMLKNFISPEKINDIFNSYLSSDTIGDFIKDLLIASIPIAVSIVGLLLLLGLLFFYGLWGYIKIGSFQNECMPAVFWLMPLVYFFVPGLGSFIIMCMAVNAFWNLNNHGDTWNGSEFKKYFMVKSAGKVSVGNLPAFLYSPLQWKNNAKELQHVKQFINKENLSLGSTAKEFNTKVIEALKSFINKSI